MKKLLEELRNERIFTAFLSKAFFNAGEVNYLAIKRPNKNFHIFEKHEIENLLNESFRLDNSKARHAKEHDCQKVLLKLENDKGRWVNAGEIEVRNDSDRHYKEMKFRLNGLMIFDLLEKKIAGVEKKGNRVFAHGRAIKTFKM